MLQWRPFNDIPELTRRSPIPSPTIQWKHQYQYHQEEEDTDDSSSSPQDDLSPFYYSSHNTNTLPKLYAIENTFQQIPSLNQDSYFTYR